MRSSKSPTNLLALAIIAALAGMVSASTARALPVTSPAPASQPEWHAVSEVISGDTFRLDTGTLVTYSSIASPPLQHPDPKVRDYAQKALAFNRTLLDRKKIRVQFGSQIRNEEGVYQGFVFLEDGTFANLRMIEEGYAKLKIIPPNLQYARELREASTHARRGGSGLWEFENKVTRRFIFLGDKMTHKFHFAGCRMLRGVSKAHLKRFESSLDAKADGYEFCSECRHVYAQETDLF